MSMQENNRKLLNKVNQNFLFKKKNSKHFFLILFFSFPEQRELSRRSQVIQRDLPRPIDVNLNILRPASDSLSDLQRAEELIKREMITMLQYDTLNNPVALNKRSNNILSQAQSYLNSHPYKNYEKDDLDDAKKLIENEMNIVRKGMDHGDISLEAYCTVWEECLSQVFSSKFH